MASATRKRKAAGSLEVPEKRTRVEKLLNPRKEIIKSDPNETEDDYSDNEDDDSDNIDDDQLADTPNTPFSPRKKWPSELKTIKCTFEGCEKTFNRASRLATHISSHKNERPHVCTYENCEKSYFDKKHLNQHIKGSHTNERSYECNWEGCQKSFLTATRLRRHIGTHEGHNRFRCREYPPCNQTFRKRNTLQRHIRSDHMSLTPYPCTYIDPMTREACNAGFDGAAGLRKHEDRVHGLPQFFCPDCTLPGINPDGSAIHLGFTTDTQLHNHIKKEHANCPFCDKKCSSQRELQKHVESQHSGISLEQRKNIPCTYEDCDKKFTKISNRNVHIQTQHEGQRFICGTYDVSKIPDISSFESMADGCGKDYVSKANLEDHIRTAHFQLPSLINANRKKPTLESEDEEEVQDFDLEMRPKRKTKKSQTSALDELLGTAYEADPRRNIPCLVTTCAHLFIRDYDLQQHLRTKHRLSTPEIEAMEHEEENEPEFQFPVGDIRNDDAYGGEGGEEDFEFERDIRAQDLENIPFWIGGDNGGEDRDEWGQEELEMRRLIGEEGFGDEFGGGDE